MLIQKKTPHHKLDVNYSWCITFSLFYTDQIMFNLVQNHTKSDKLVMVSTSLDNFALQVNHSMFSSDGNSALVLLSGEY